MAKDKTIFTCSDCGGTTPRWLGKCPACGAWNTLIESTLDAGGNAKNRYTSQFQALAKTSALTKLGDIEATDVDRSPTGLEELDRALGGGVVEGGVILIGGDPGIGKSTLLLQALDALQRKGMNTLYVTGEESGAQVALRSRRLGLDHSQVQVLAEIQLEKILRPTHLGAGFGGAGQRVRRTPYSCRQSHRYGHRLGWPRHQRGRLGWAPCVGAHGRHCLVF